MTQDILFHEKNVGKAVRLKSGKNATISRVLSFPSKWRSREDEALGLVIDDYDFEDVSHADGLVVSFDGGETWRIVSVRPWPTREEDLQPVDAMSPPLKIRKPRAVTTSASDVPSDADMTETSPGVSVSVPPEHIVIAPRPDDGNGLMNPR